MSGCSTRGKQRRLPATRVTLSGNRICPAIEVFGVGMFTGVNLSESLGCISGFSCYNHGVADFVEESFWFLILCLQLRVAGPRS